MGYNEKSWQQSVIIDFIRSDQAPSLIYSNASDAIYILTNKHTLSIPSNFDPVTQKPNVTYSENVIEIGKHLLKERGILVYFNKITWRHYNPSLEDLKQQLPLKLLLKTTDGEIYTL